VITTPFEVILAPEVLMALRKVRDAGEARACLAAVEESGLPRAEWARRNGVDARSLNAWRLNLARGELRRSDLRLVEWVPQAVDRPLIVRVGPFAVEVDADFDAAALRRLIEVVASC
jgi:hypothetical protein